MANDFPPFAFTTQESWYGELSFKAAEDGSALSLAGRQFEIHITPASSGAQLVTPVIVLTMETGRGLSLKQGDPSTLVFRVPKTTANTFPRQEYTADVLEVVEGERYLFMPVRITYAEPSGLRSFLTRFLGVSVSFASRQQPIYTPLAVPGREGRPGATILRGTVPPVPADGKDSDYYIEDRTASGQGRRMWGPKAGGAWPGTPWNIQVAAYADVPGLAEVLDAKANAASLGTAAAKAFAAAGGVAAFDTTPVRFYPENFGALANGGDDGDAILDALAAATAVKGVVVLRGKTYGTSKTLKIPSLVTLLLEGATLNLLANVVGVRVSNAAVLDGYGEISAASAPGFSEAVVEINGADSVTRGRISGLIRLANAPSSKTGVGFRMIAAGTGASRIDYVDATFAAINNFAIGVHYKASGTAFVNSNYLNAGVIFGCLESIVLETDGTGGMDSNFFRGATQTDTTRMDAIRALRIAGQGNQFDMMIWDWQASANPATAITFSAGSSRNQVRSPMGPERVEDLGSSYRYTANQILDWYNQAPIQRSVLPASMRYQTYAGNQDDIFAYADKHPPWTVTQTAGSAPTSGSLANVFNLNASSSAAWNNTSTFPVSIEIDFGGTLQYFMGQGLAFNFGGVASNVTLETFRNGAWETRKTWANNASASLSYQEDNFSTNVTKVRLTFSGLPSSNSIQLGKWFGFAAGPEGGYAYRSRLSTEAVFLHTTVPPTPPTGYASFYKGPGGQIRWKEANGNVYQVTGTLVP